MCATVGSTRLFVCVCVCVFSVSRKRRSVMDTEENESMRGIGSMSRKAPTIQSHARIVTHRSRLVMCVFRNILVFVDGLTFFILRRPSEEGSVECTNPCLTFGDGKGYATPQYDA